MHIWAVIPMVSKLGPTTRPEGDELHVHKWKKITSVLKVIFFFYLKLISFFKKLFVAIQAVERETRKSLYYLLEMPRKHFRSTA